MTARYSTAKPPVAWRNYRYRPNPNEAVIKNLARIEQEIRTEIAQDGSQTWLLKGGLLDRLLQAKRAFTREDLERQTAGVECRKDDGVLDEIPSAYKPIDAVMAAQSDLVEIVAELKQVLCVKG